MRGEAHNPTMLSFCGYKSRIDDGVCAAVGNNRKVKKATQPVGLPSSMSRPPRRKDTEYSNSINSSHYGARQTIDRTFRDRDARDDTLAAASTGPADWNREQTNQYQAHRPPFLATQDHSSSEEENRAYRYYPRTQDSWSSPSGTTYRTSTTRSWEPTSWADRRAIFAFGHASVRNEADPSSTYKLTTNYPSTQGYEKHGPGFSHTDAPFEQGRPKEAPPGDKYPTYRQASPPPPPRPFESQPRRWDGGWHDQYGNVAHSGRPTAESTSTRKGMVELHSPETERKWSAHTHRNRTRELGVERNDVSAEHASEPRPSASFEDRRSSRKFDATYNPQPVAAIASVNSDESSSTLGQLLDVPPELETIGESSNRFNEPFPTFGFRPVISEDSAPHEPASAKRMKTSFEQRIDTSPNSLDLLCSATLELGPLQDNPAGCSCPRSKCIKLYCDCFAAGRRCSGECSCSNCKNTVEESGATGERTKAIKNILARNPRAFTGGKKDAAPRNPGDIVCNCVKSKCLKLYCACFLQGKTCTDACSCVLCLNTTEESHVGGRRKMAIQMALEKRPDAFTKKPKEIGSGCACKNNRCLKKYCDCYRFNLSCSDKCVCKECGNQASVRIGQIASV